MMRNNGWERDSTGRRSVKVNRRPGLKRLIHHQNIGNMIAISGNFPQVRNLRDLYI